MSNEARRAFTIEQFGRRWNLGRNLVYDEIARGYLGTIKVGRKRLITAEQEEAFRELKEQEK